MINYWERYSSDETWSGATEHARPATKAKAAPRVWPGEGEALIASKAEAPPTTVPTATAKPPPTALPTASAPHFFTQQQRDQHESDTEKNEPPHRDITLEGLCRIHKNRMIAKTKLAQRRGSVHGTSPPTTIGEHSGQLRLSRLNNHSRDERISFIEESHTYYLDGSVQFPMSVSSVWSKFFAVFDAENIIETYFDKWATNLEASTMEPSPRVDIAQYQMRRSRSASPLHGIIKALFPVHWELTCIGRLNFS